MEKWTGAPLGYQKLWSEENQQFLEENKYIMDKGFLYINSLINNTVGVFIEVL